MNSSPGAELDAYDYDLDQGIDPCDWNAPERNYDVPENEPVPRRHAGSP